MSKNSMKNPMSAIKISLDAINNKLETAEEKVTEHVTIAKWSKWIKKTEKIKWTEVQWPVGSYEIWVTDVSLTRKLEGKKTEKYLKK